MREPVPRRGGISAPVVLQAVQRGGSPQARVAGPARKRLAVSLLHMTVLQTWERIGHDRGTTTAWPWTVTGACAVLAVWALVATLLAVLTSDRRDQ